MRLGNSVATRRLFSKTACNSHFKYRRVWRVYRQRRRAVCYSFHDVNKRSTRQRAFSMISRGKFWYQVIRRVHFFFAECQCSGQYWSHSSRRRCTRCIHLRVNPHTHTHNVHTFIRILLDTLIDLWYINVLCTELEYIPELQETKVFLPMFPSNLEEFGLQIGYRIQLECWVYSRLTAQVSK